MHVRAVWALVCAIGADCPGTGEPPVQAASTFRHNGTDSLVPSPSRRTDADGSESFERVDPARRTSVSRVRCEDLVGSGARSSDRLWGRRGRLRTCRHRRGPAEASDEPRKFLEASSRNALASTVRSRDGVHPELGRQPPVADRHEPPGLEVFAYEAVPADGKPVAACRRRQQVEIVLECLDRGRRRGAAMGAEPSVPGGPAGAWPADIEARHAAPSTRMPGEHRAEALRESGRGHRHQPLAKHRDRLRVGVRAVFGFEHDVEAGGDQEGRRS